MDHFLKNILQFYGKLHFILLQLDYFSCKFLPLVAKLIRGTFTNTFHRRYLEMPRKACQGEFIHMMAIPKNSKSFNFGSFSVFNQVTCFSSKCSTFNMIFSMKCPIIFPSHSENRGSLRKNHDTRFKTEKEPRLKLFEFWACFIAHELWSISKYVTYIYSDTKCLPGKDNNFFSSECFRSDVWKLIEQKINSVFVFYLQISRYAKKIQYSLLPVFLFQDRPISWAIHFTGFWPPSWIQGRPINLIKSFEKSYWIHQRPLSVIWNVHFWRHQRHFR